MNQVTAHIWGYRCCSRLQREKYKEPHRYQLSKLSTDASSTSLHCLTSSCPLHLQQHMNPPHSTKGNFMHFFTNNNSCSPSRAWAVLAQSLCHVQLSVTLWAIAHQAPLSMGFLQPRILEWVAMPSSRESSQPTD